METLLDSPIATTAPITITDGALDQLNQIRQQENISADYCLRVGVKGGGCSGFSYVRGFDLPTESDEHFEIGNLNVIMNKAHAIYLLGMQVDFVTDNLLVKGYERYSFGYYNWRSIWGNFPTS